MNGRPIQVLHKDGTWAIYRKGQALPVAEFQSRREAVAEASRLASYYDVGLTILDVPAVPEIDVVPRESFFRTARRVR